MGGEEFNLILPGVDSQGGAIAAERIRKAIESVELEKIEQISQWVIDRVIWLEEAKLIFEEA